MSINRILTLWADEPQILCGGNINPFGNFAFGHAIRHVGVFIPFLDVGCAAVIAMPVYGDDIHHIVFPAGGWRW